MRNSKSVLTVNLKHHVCVPKLRWHYLVNNSVWSRIHTMSLTLNLGTLGRNYPASTPAHILYSRHSRVCSQQLAQLMEAVRTAYTKSRLGLNTQTTHEANDPGKHAAFVNILFHWISRWILLWRCLWNASFNPLFVFIRMNFWFLWANFSSTCIQYSTCSKAKVTWPLIFDTQAWIQCRCYTTVFALCFKGCVTFLTM